MPFRLLLLSLLLLPLAACDETGGITDGDGGALDVEVSVGDAVVARNQGDFATAVTLLDRALVAEPQNARVRVELATTLLQRDGIDLLDLERVGRFLTETATNARPAGAQAQGRGGCAAATDPTAQAFDPTAVEGFDEIRANLETIAQAEETLDPVIPAALQSFDLCTSVAGGALDYDRDGAVRALRDQGLTDAQVTQALAVYALAQFLDAYVFVTEELPQEVTWYRLADGTVTICATDEDAFEVQAQAAVQDFGKAVLSLDARASLLGADSVAAGVVATALQTYEEVRDAIADFCSADARRASA